MADVEYDEYDDTPYREVQRIAPVLTVSAEFHEEDPHADVWVFVDGADTRIARQRFSYHGYHDNGAYEDWLATLLNGLRNDPEGRDQCADCGNVNLGYGCQHAPDCRYAHLPNPNPVDYHG